jgi:hypothetical protein
MEKEVAEQPLREITLILLSGIISENFIKRVPRIASLNTTASSGTH